MDSFQTDRGLEAKKVIFEVLEISKWFFSQRFVFYKRNLYWYIIVDLKERKFLNTVC